MEYLTVRKLFLFSQEDRRTLHTWIWISSRPVKNYNYKFQDNCIWIRGLFQGNPGPRLFPALSRPGNLIFEFQDFPESVWTLLIILSTFPLWLKLEVTTTREYPQPKNILNRYVKNSHVTVGCDWGGGGLDPWTLPDSYAFDHYTAVWWLMYRKTLHSALFTVPSITTSVPTHYLPT